MTPQDVCDVLIRALLSPNVQGALRLVRNGESDAGNDEAYRALYGWRPGNGRVFDSFDDHPRIRTYETHDEFIHNGKRDYTTAAGAYQATETTWGDFLRACGPHDFSPASQDLFAAWCFYRHGALADVLAGRIHAAIFKCRKEWASLPTSDYGQPTKALAEAIEIYKGYGGTVTDEPQQVSSPVPVAPDSPPTQEVRVTPHVTEVPMPAILAALLPTILQSIPQLISVFGSGNDSDVAKRNQAAGVLVADTLVKATNAVNLQDAVDRMQSDPSALDAAHKAVNDLLPSLVDSGGGGIEGARQFAAAHESGRYGRVIEVVSYVALAFLGFANVVSAVFAFREADFSVMADMKQADIGAALIALGFWLGNSVTKQPPK